MSDEEEYESSQPGDDDDGEVSQETNDEGERVVFYYCFDFGLVLFCMLNTVLAIMKQLKSLCANNKLLNCLHYHHENASFILYAMLKKSLPKIRSE